jgi:hypothetical protein
MPDWNYHEGGDAALVALIGNTNHLIVGKNP